MADEHPEFWFPPLFLCDDDNFNKTDLPLSSSTETESDQDEFLTRRLTTSIHHLWNPKPIHGFPPNHKTDTLWKMPAAASHQSDEKVGKITGGLTVTGGYIQYWGPPGSNGNGRLSEYSAWPSLQQTQSRKLHVPRTSVPLVTTSGTGVFFPRPRPTQTPHRTNHSAAALKHRNVSTQSQQSRRNMSPSPATMHNEIRLPQEWTY